jgi:hypothetical protein
MTASARPTGITILAILAAIGGVLGIVGGLGVTLLGGLLSAYTGVFGGLITIIGLAAIIVGVAQIVSAYGFWTLKPWGWMVGVGIAVANIVIAVLWYLAGSGISNQILSVVISAVILYYLWQPSIKALFGRS